jgi:hypothetical protein
VLCLCALCSRIKQVAAAPWGRKPARSTSKCSTALHVVVLHANWSHIRRMGLPVPVPNTAPHALIVSPRAFSVLRWSKFISVHYSSARIPFRPVVSSLETVLVPVLLLRFVPALIVPRVASVDSATRWKLVPRSLTFVVLYAHPVYMQWALRSSSHTLIPLSPPEPELLLIGGTCSSAAHFARVSFGISASLLGCMLDFCPFACS